MYTISYNHRSSEEATSKEQAIRYVRIEARMQKRFGAPVRLRHVQGNDGLYLYEDTESMKRDPDGSRAFAVISKD